MLTIGNSLESNAVHASELAATFEDTKDFTRCHFCYSMIVAPNKCWYCMRSCVTFSTFINFFFYNLSYFMDELKLGKNSRDA